MFQFGKFKSHSGEVLHWKIECDDLTLADWKCLACVIKESVVPFGSVEGVPMGGCCLADLLKPYVTKGPLLIVDDVLTTGGSMEEHRAGRLAIGAVVFARGLCPAWVTPIFSYIPKRTK